MSIVQTISPFEYIGNSVQKINNNFNNFDTYFTKLSADAVVALKDFRTAITNQQSYVSTVRLSATDVTRLDQSVNINAGNITGATLIGNSLAPTTIGGNLTVLGTATAPTVTSSDSSTNIATTAFVKGQNYITTTTGQFSLGTNGGAVTINKSDNSATTTIYGSSISLAGTAATAPTVTSSDSSTNIATTAFVKAQNYITGATALVNFGTAATGAVTVGKTDQATTINSSSPISLGTSTSVTGNLTLNTAGNGLLIKEGTNATMGLATLAAGTVTVSTNKVTASSRIFLTVQTAGGTQGFLRVSARSANTSFTITSTSNTETSTVAWMIVEPA